jgi:hypothetical protein
MTLAVLNKFEGKIASIAIKNQKSVNASLGSYMLIKVLKPSKQFYQLLGLTWTTTFQVTESGT